MQYQFLAMKKDAIRGIGFLVLLISCYFIVTSLMEFYNAGIYKKENDAYAFGQLNTDIWYYKTAEMYARYNLSCGLCLLVTSIWLVYFLIKFNKPAVIFLTLLLLLEMLAVLLVIDKL